MDPITTVIVAALASGAMEATKDSASQAVIDAYASLKALLQKKFAETQDGEVGELALAKYEEKPEAWKGPLEEELIRAEVGKDKQIVETAQKLAALVTPRDAAYERIATATSATRGFRSNWTKTNVTL